MKENEIKEQIIQKIKEIKSLDSDLHKMMMTSKELNPLFIRYGQLIFKKELE